MTSRLRWAFPPALASGLVLCGLAALIFAPWLVPGRAPYSPYSDIVPEHLALKQLGFEAWSERRSLPLWRQDQFCGAPLLTNPQALYLHPVHVLFWLMPPLAAFGPTFVLQFCVFAFGCAALSRLLGASRGAALFCGSAALAALKPMQIAQAGWLPPLATLALVPWLLAGLFALAEQPNRQNAAKLALIAAVAFAGGSPQLLYYAGLLVAPYFVLTSASREPRAALTAGARRLTWLVAALALGLACNAYLWGSIASEWALIARSAQSRDLAFFFSGHALGPKRLLTLLQPHAFGEPVYEPWEENAYFGAVPLVLSLLAGVRAPARSAARYCFWALLASLLLSLDTPLLRLAHAYIPGYASFRMPGRMLFLTSCLGIALAGPGLDRVLSSARLDSRWRAILLVLSIAVVTLEGMHYARRYLGTAPYAQLQPALDHPARRIATLAGAGAADARGARTAVAGRNSFNYGWASELGLRLVNGYDPYNYAHYKRFMALLDRGEPINRASNWVDIQHLARPDLLDEISARYLLADREIPLPQLELLHKQTNVRNFVLYEGMLHQPLYLYENRSARPYARFARMVRRVASIELMAERMRRTRLTGQAYILDAGTDWLPESPVSDPEERVLVEQLESRRVRLRTRASTPRLLVLAETFHPGWRARVDGRAVAPLQVNLALLGLPLPSGTHRVVLELAPLHFAWNVRISLLAFAILLCWLGFEAWLRARGGQS